MKYNTLATFAKSRSAWIISFVWGLAEGLVFFIIPDVFLGFVALLSISGGMIALWAALAGSLVSAIIIFAGVSYFGSAYESILTAIPGISTEMIAQVSINIQTYGLSALIKAPLEGVPYKIYSVHAAKEGFSLIEYLLWSIPSRLERTLPVTLIALAVGFACQKNIKGHTNRWVLGYIVFWTGIYVFYYFSLI